MTERWSDQAKSSIKQITEEFNRKIKDSDDNKVLDTKIHDFFSAAEKKYEERCLSQINELMKLGKTENENFVPNLGVEKELESATNNLKECRKPFMDTINNFTYISQYTKKLFQMQNDMCFDECDKNEKNPEKLRECLTKCGLNSIKYPLKSLTKLLADTADSFKEELKKL
jgi:hypothetical protein